MAVNPDPTTTNLTLTCGTAGAVTATVDVWEMVAKVTVPAQTITLPTGRWLVTLIVAGLPGTAAPPVQTAQQDVTLGAPGTVTLPATKLLHIRDFTAARSVQVFVTVALRVGSAWVDYANTGPANGVVSVPAAAIPSAGSLPKFGTSVGQVAGTVAALTLTSQTYLDGALSTIVAMGGTITRNDPQWMQLCPSSRTFDATIQAAYDAYFTSLAAKSLKAVVFLCPIITSPAWAATGGTRGNPPASWTDFENFVSDFLTRWGANIAAVELINEPDINVAPNGGGQTTPANYVAYLAHLYTAAKAYSAAMPVLAGALSYADSTYLAALYATGSFKGNYDAISVHPYGIDNGQYDTPLAVPIANDPSVALLEARKVYSILEGLEAFHEVMRANSEGTVPIWITEMGWQTGNTGTAGACTSYDVTEAQQATFLAYAARALSRLGYVNAVLFYAGRDDSPLSTAVPYGVTDYWGNRRKPAVAALTSAISGLNAGTG